MTYRTETSRASKRALHTLVVIFIVWVALWASTGGLDRLLADESATVVVSSSA